MKTILSGVIFLAFTFMAVPEITAQSETDVIKSKVNTALGQYLKKVYPPKYCDLNDCAFFYRNDMVITQNQEVGRQLKLWGKAKVTYRNSRTGGDGIVFFYAELEKVEGEITVTGLKWRIGDCMKFEPLM
ncbi:MAG: hypothetical protein R3C61_09255 [Bacteroidia bacterium]